MHQHWSKAKEKGLITGAATRSQKTRLKYIKITFKVDLIKKSDPGPLSVFFTGGHGGRKYLRINRNPDFFPDIFCPPPFWNNPVSAPGGEASNFYWITKKGLLLITWLRKCTESCNHNRIVFEKMSSLTALARHLWMKTAFYTKDIKSQYFWTFIMKI